MNESLFAEALTAAAASELDTEHFLVKSRKEQQQRPPELSARLQPGDNEGFHWPATECDGQTFGPTGFPDGFNGPPVARGGTELASRCLRCPFQGERQPWLREAVSAILYPQPPRAPTPPPLQQPN